MAGCANSESAPASKCLPGGGDSLGHAPGAGPPGGRAAAAEGGAGLARVSATVPQVATGAGLGRGREVSAVPRLPSILWPARSPMRTGPRSPDGHEGQRLGEAWGFGKQAVGGCAVGASASPR